MTDAMIAISEVVSPVDAVLLLPCWSVPSASEFDAPAVSPDPDCDDEAGGREEEFEFDIVVWMGTIGLVSYW